jgi:hypothetical protein
MVPTIAHRIRTVFFFSSQIQMIWIYASTIVATMENMHIERDRTAMYLPRRSMRGDGRTNRAAFATLTNRAVAVPRNRTNPQPAS